jgi:hypothetical protein
MQLLKSTGYLTVTALFLFGCSGIKKSTTSSIQQKDGLYSISQQNQVFEVDAISGAKVSAIKVDGYNFLTDSVVHARYWGSSFWISPEAVWDWTTKEVDRKPYTSRIEDGKIIMTSPKGEKSGLLVTKIFSAIKESNSFLVEYTVKNESDTIKDIAPWEVTRVHVDGLAFFPIGDGTRRGGLLPFTTEKDGISWYQYRAEDVPLKGNRQLYSDGKEGWLAQVNGQLVLIKKFKDMPLENAAPEEAEVEWYASPVNAGHSYVEVEHQGPYAHLKPGQSLTWKSEWYLRKLPADIKPEAGNVKLVEYVRKIVK